MRGVMATAIDKVLKAAARYAEQHQRVRQRIETYRLTLLHGIDWSKEDYDVRDSDQGGEVADTIEQAEAVTSLVRGSKPPDGTVGNVLTPEGGLHHLLVDIDHTGAEWVPSSTEGHHHLYVPLGPNGVPWELYKNWLEASAAIGLIEEGYKNACLARGYSVLRLPWIVKGEEAECVAEGAAPPAPNPWDGGGVF